MFDARVHLGHKEGTLNEKMKAFVVGSRLGSLIIDLNQSKELLGDALNFTAHIASRGGIILFINRSRQVSMTLFLGMKVFSFSRHFLTFLSALTVLIDITDGYHGREVGQRSGRVLAVS